MNEILKREIFVAASTFIIGSGLSLGLMFCYQTYNDSVEVKSNHVHDSIESIPMTSSSTYSTSKIISNDKYTQDMICANQSAKCYETCSKDFKIHADGFNHADQEYRITLSKCKKECADSKEKCLINK